MRSRDDNARGAAECVIDSRDRKPRSIIPVVYERERCFNWFVARFEPVKQEKARGNDGLRTAVHARILQRAVMDVAADALAESLGAVASELLLATENAADDPNFSISPEGWFDPPPKWRRLSLSLRQSPTRPLSDVSNGRFASPVNVR